LNHKKAKILYDVLAVIGFILLLAGYWDKLDWLSALGLVFMAACVFVSLKWNRCPHCHAYLGRSARASNHCPECGEEL